MAWNETSYNKKTKRKKKWNETRWRTKNGVWTPFGVTFASSMQTALRQTSNCLFSMRSYRVSLEYDTRTHFILRLCFSLYLSFSVTLFHSFPCTHAQQTFLPSRSRTTMRHSLSSLTTHFVLLFTNFTPPSFFLSPINKRVHLFFFFNFRVAWSFVYPWTKKVCVNDTQILEYRSGSPTSIRCDHIFHVRCWFNDLAYT